MCFIYRRIRTTCRSVHSYKVHLGCQEKLWTIIEFMIIFGMAIILNRSDWNNNHEINPDPSSHKSKWNCSQTVLLIWSGQYTILILITTHAQTGIMILWRGPAHSHVWWGENEIDMKHDLKVQNNSFFILTNSILFWWWQISDFTESHLNLKRFFCLFFPDWRIDYLLLHL